MVADLPLVGLPLILQQTRPSEQGGNFSVCVVSSTVGDSIVRGIAPVPSSAG
jgi:hypothetical protein